MMPQLRASQLPSLAPSPHCLLAHSQILRRLLRRYPIPNQSHSVHIPSYSHLGHDSAKERNGERFSTRSPLVMGYPIGGGMPGNRRALSGDPPASMRMHPPVRRERHVYASNIKHLRCRWRGVVRRGLSRLAEVVPTPRSRRLRRYFRPLPDIRKRQAVTLWLST